MLQPHAPNFQLVCTHVQSNFSYGIQISFVFHALVLSEYSYIFYSLVNNKLIVTLVLSE